MKILKIYILVVLISLIIGVGSAFNTPIENFDIDAVTKENENTEVVEEIVEPVKEEVVIEEPKVEEQIEVKKTEPKKDTPKAKEQPNQTQKQETKTVSSDSKKEDSKPVVKKPWEELGLSEDEYYNKPIMKWQKVTHANMDACKKEGQETIDDENNDYSNFWCYEVYSPSGKFLGAMLSLS